MPKRTNFERREVKRLKKEDTFLRDFMMSEMQKYVGDEQAVALCFRLIESVPEMHETLGSFIRKRTIALRKIREKFPKSTEENDDEYSERVNVLITEREVCDLVDDPEFRGIYIIDDIMMMAERICSIIVGTLPIWFHLQEYPGFDDILKNKDDRLSDLISDFRTLTTVRKTKLLNF